MKKLIGRKSVSLKNPVKRNWSCKRAWLGNLFLFLPLLLFWKCEVPPQIWKLGVCHVVVKLPVLPKACAIPCWEKPGERENVISDCLWATVWENEQCSSCQWAGMPVDWQDLSWGGVAEQAERQEPQAPMASARTHHLTRDAVSDASCSALHRSRCYGQAGSELGCTLNTCWLSFGAMLQGGSWSLKGMGCKNPDYLKKKVLECSSSPALPFPALKL